MSDEIPEPSDRILEAEAGKFHGPAKVTIDKVEDAIWILKLEAGEEGDILHTAADWMNSRRFATITAINWIGDTAGDEEPPNHTMTMVIDMSWYYRKRF